ncbi:hypothetical protein AUR63_00700 [Guyparkeria sp. XI15]|nr:hypothetical protein AUR63_00700 [Guyparkeria sp. XI15]OAE85651.1 hypothetical protein AWR35_00700 [Guyparkeria sp. WRN-7]
MKTLLASAIAVMLTPPVLAEPPEGLYSMDGLIGSEVYLAAEDNREAGEVEDVLVAENMKVHGLVIEFDDDLEGFEDDDRRFVEVDQFSVATRAGNRLDRVSYAVFLTDDLEQVRDYPRVDDDWWAEAKEGAARIWESTKSGAASAWQATKETGSDVFDKTKEKTREMLESLQRTLE